MPNDDIKRRARAAAASKPAPVVTEVKTAKPRKRLPWWVIAGAVVLLVIVGYVLLTMSSNANFSRIAVKSGITLRCQSENIQADCDAYTESIMAQHEAQVMECHRQYMYPTYAASFYRCLEESGIVTP